MDNSGSNNWTIEDDKIFETGLVDYPEGSLNRWENLANLFSPPRTPEEMIARYDVLVRDVSDIEAGRYNYLLHGYMSNEQLVAPHEEFPRNLSVGKSSSSLQASSSGTEKRNAEQSWRTKGKSWTEDEHRKFLIGLNKYGKGDWRSIARNCVKTRTPGQVASHAQKYFIRQEMVPKNTTRKKRSSIHDIQTPGGGPTGSTTTVHNVPNTLYDTNPVPVPDHDHQNLALQITSTTPYCTNPCSPPPPTQNDNALPDYHDHDHQNLPLQITCTTSYCTNPCPLTPRNCNAPSPSDYHDHDHQNHPLQITSTTPYCNNPCPPPPPIRHSNAPPDYPDHDHRNLPLEFTNTTSYSTNSFPPPPPLTKYNAPPAYHDHQNLPTQNTTTTYSTNPSPSPPPLTNYNALPDYQDHENLPTQITTTTYSTNPSPSPPPLRNYYAPSDYPNQVHQNLPMQITTTTYTTPCPPPLRNGNALPDYPSQARSYTNFPIQGGYDHNYIPTFTSDLPPLPTDLLSDHNLGFEITNNNPLPPLISDYPEPDQGDDDLSTYDFDQGEYDLSTFDFATPSTSDTNDNNPLSYLGNFLGQEGDDLINFDFDFTGV